MNEKYLIEFDDVAKKQLKKLEKSGQQIYLKKVFSFLEELKINPRIGSGKPEQMKYYQSEVWSRKINKKDRFVYEIIETKKIVFVTQVIGHYQDK